MRSFGISADLYLKIGKKLRLDSLLLLIIISSVTLRLYLAAASVYIWDEERDWIPLAESISLNPFNFPIRGDYHPALVAYFIKAGSEVLGSNPIGFRFVNVIAGLLTITTVYKLTLEWTDNLIAARWAVVLLAFNEYHIGASALAVEKSFHLLFVLLSVAAFLRFLRTNRPIFLYLAGAATGLAFLCKEIAILLIPIFFLTLVAPRNRRWLKTKVPYLAMLVFIIAIMPDLAWNLTQFEMQSQVNLGDRLSQIGLGFTLQPLVFFFRGVIIQVYNLLGGRFIDPGMDYPAMNGLFGLILFAGALSTVFHRSSNPNLNFLKFLFWLVFVLFLFLPSANPSRTDIGSAAFYWVNLTILPAVVLAGVWLSELSKKWLLLVRFWLLVAVVIACLQVLFLRLGLPSIAVRYDPEFIWPADGRMVQIQAKFNSCAICEKDMKVELVAVNVINESQGRVISGVETSDVEDATLWTDDREFKVRASGTPGDRRYEFIYRLTDSSGRVHVLDDKPFGTVGVRVTSSSSVPWRSPFWSAQ